MACMGQGLATVLLQFVAEAAGLDWGQVDVAVPDESIFISRNFIVNIQKLKFVLDAPLLRRLLNGSSSCRQ